MNKNGKLNAGGRRASSGQFTLGWQGINKLNAIEGIHLSDSSREMFAGFERDGTSAAPRNAEERVYDLGLDPYCYPGTTVLKNRLDLTSQSNLDAFEADAVTGRGLEPLPAGRFTPTHLRAIHHHLFQDVYAWADRYRTIRISKGNSMFCYPEHIHAQVRSLFAWLGDRRHLANLNTSQCFQAQQGTHSIYLCSSRRPFSQQ